MYSYLVLLLVAILAADTVSLLHDGTKDADKFNHWDWAALGTNEDAAGKSLGGDAAKYARRLTPDAGQIFKCFVGFPCTVGPVSGTLANGNRLRVMGSCSTPKGTSRFVGGTAAFADVSSPLLGSQADPAISEALAGGSSTFSFGSAVVVGPGTRYELCWCSSGCNSVSDFSTQVGFLDVPGPSDLFDVECAAGRACNFVLVGNPGGVDIGDGDKVAVFVQCPSTPSAPTIPSGFPAGGVSKFSEDGRNFTWDGETFGGATVPFVETQPGNYKLCWCHRDLVCSDSSNFRFEIGKFTFAGPVGQQTWECVRGHTCSVGVQGFALSTGDQFQVMETCGEGDISDGFGNGHVVVDSVLPIDDVSGGTSVSYQWPNLDAAAGNYNLCWLAHWQATSSQSCQELGWSSEEAGSPEVCAAPASEGAICDTLTLSAAIATCLNKGARLCTGAELVQGNAGGTPCASSNSMWAVRPCGPGSQVVADTSASVASLTCSSYSFTRSAVCCADVTVQEFPVPQAAFRTVAGAIAVRGPIAQESYCVLNETCTFSLDGVRLDKSTDVIQITEGGYKCETGENGNSSAFDSARAHGLESSPDAGKPTFSVGMVSAFGTFEVCWCTQAGTRKCDQDSDFNVYVGILLVGGMFQQTAYCVFQQPCTVRLVGSNLGASDALLVIPMVAQCTDIRTVVLSTEVQINPAVAEKISVKTAKSFHLGKVSDHLDFRICYCINVVGRECISDGSPTLPQFNMDAGVLEIMGPKVNATIANARTGAPYNLRLEGRLFRRHNRISIVSAESGLQCGDEGSNISDSMVEIPFEQPGAITINSQTFYGVQIVETGEYIVCWCLGSMKDGCKTAEEYDVPAAFLTVDGLYKDRDVYFSNEIVARPFALVTYGSRFAPSDSVSFVRVGSVRGSDDEEIPCGQAFRKNDQGLVQGTDVLPRIVGNVEAVWPEVIVNAVGRYLVCWCGRDVCSRGEHFNILAARINVTGPEIAVIPSVLSGEFFDVEFTGTGFDDFDRISIVPGPTLDGDGGVVCGTEKASVLASTVIPQVIDPNSPSSGSSAGISALLLGPPTFVSDEGDKEVWSGLRIRWSGINSICWAGNHSSSKRCSQRDTDGECNQYESTHHPYHVGDIRVFDNHVTVTGEEEISRCSSYDVLVIPPNPGNEDNEAAYAKWTCVPPQLELCSSLQSTYLNREARNKLSLHIGVERMNDALDRTMWIASALGNAWKVLNVSLLVDLIDAQNVTRSGSINLRISADSPQVQAMSRNVRLERGTNELRLSISVHLPILGSCDVSSGSASDAVHVIWYLDEGGRIELAQNNTADDPFQLAMSIRDVSNLGVGRHKFLAVVEFNKQDYLPQEVDFTVEVLERYPLSVELVTPEKVPSDCPVVLDASFSADNRNFADILTYTWTCLEEDGSSCNAGAEVSANMSSVATGSLGINASGKHRFAVTVTASDGRSASSRLSSVEISPKGPLQGSDWPVAILPLPTLVGANRTLHCVGTAVQSETSNILDHCGHPRGANWLLRNVNGADQALESEIEVVSTGGKAVHKLVAVVPASLLRPGAAYRCVLRNGNVDLHETTVFDVAPLPAGGRLVAAPSRGTVLQTRFMLRSFAWSSDHPPLEHRFIAVIMASKSDRSKSDESNETNEMEGAEVLTKYDLRGWSALHEFTCILGHSGMVRVVAQVRDIFGSVAEANIVIHVAPATGIKISPVPGMLEKFVAWPPTARSVTAVAAAVLDYIEAGSVRMNTQEVAEIVNSLLVNLWNVLEHSLTKDFTREDIDLRTAVVGDALENVSDGEGGIHGLMAAANLLDMSADQCAEISASSTRDPIEHDTAFKLLSSVSVLAASNFTLGGQDEIRFLFRLARRTTYNLGIALIAKLRRDSAQWGTDTRWQNVDSKSMNLTASLVFGVAGSRIKLEAIGVEFEIPGVQYSRRLADQEGRTSACPSQAIITHWGVVNPLGLAPLVNSVNFSDEGKESQLAEGDVAGERRPRFATFYLRDCMGASVMPTSPVTVSIFVHSSVSTTTSTVIRYNETHKLLMEVNVSWICSQWDDSVNHWIASSDLVAGVDQKTDIVQCFSDLRLGSEGPGGDAIILGAIPSANFMLLSAALLNPPKPDPGPTFYYIRLPVMAGIAIFIQVAMLGFCVCSRRIVTVPNPKEGAAAEVGPKSPAHLIGWGQSPNHFGISAKDGFVRYCVVLPACRILDGLILLRPWRLFPWTCKKKLQTRATIAYNPGPAPKMVLCSDFSIFEAPLSAERALEPKPPLRQDVQATLEVALKKVKNEVGDRARIDDLYPERRCLKCIYWDVRQASFRNTMLKTMKAQRLILQAGERYFKISQKMVSHGLERNVTRNALNEALTLANLQNEAFSLRVAHHALMQILLRSVDGGPRALKLTTDELRSLRCCQTALVAEFESAVQENSHISTPAGGNASTPQLRVQPYFAPAGAIRVVLVGITIGEKPKVTRAASGFKRSDSRRLDKRKSKAGKNSNLSSVVPSALDVDGIDDDVEADRILHDAQRIAGQGLIGAAYYIWGHGSMLYVQRAESLIRDYKAAPTAMDNELCRSERALGFHLEHDVRDIGVPLGDDRIICLNARGLLHMKWRGEGEVRAWANTISSIHDRLKSRSESTEQIPPQQNIRRTLVVQSILHRQSSAQNTENDSTKKSTIQYVLPAASKLAYTASTVFLETVQREVVPASIWYSHFGTTVSFTLLSPSSIGLGSHDQELSELPGSVKTPRDGDASGDRVEPTNRDVIACYVSDIISYEYGRLANFAKQEHGYCIDLVLKDKSFFRLCFNSRFARISFQASLARLKNAVFHGFSNGPADPSQDTMSAEPVGTISNASNLPPKGSLGDFWNGLCGTLEVTLLSATKIDFKSAEEDGAALNALTNIAINALSKIAAKKKGPPSPQAVVSVQSQPPPNAPETRKTPLLSMRTENPLWNCTWYFTVEYSVDDQPPSDLHFEIWDTSEPAEYMGEFDVPFPRCPGQFQYHHELENDISKLTDISKPGEGFVSLQLHWKSDIAQDYEESAILEYVHPDDATSACGRFGISCVRGNGLRAADFMSSDPYCIVSVATSPGAFETWVLATQSRTRNPEWTEVREFEVNWPKTEISNKCHLKVEFWDYDKTSSDEFLGEATFEIPLRHGDSFLEAELIPNRAKGSEQPEGHVQIRAYFREEFANAIEADPGLTVYEKAFCKFFGSRPIDEQLARSMAPWFVFLHMSVTRILRGQLGRAWHRATCGIVNPGPAFPAGFRFRGYFELSSILWADLALCCIFVHVAHDISELKTWMRVVSVLVGALVPLVTPSLAHILAQFFWFNPEAPKVNLHPSPILGAPLEAHVAPRSFGVPVSISAFVIVMSVLVVVLAVGYTETDELLNTYLTAAGCTMSFCRLILMPFVRAIFLTWVMVTVKRSCVFDWLVWVSPTTFLAHEAVT